jgi:hypothetical protein
MNDGYRCELCGAWVEYGNLSQVLAHEGPLPHVDQDRPAVRDRKQSPVEKKRGVGNPSAPNPVLDNRQSRPPCRDQRHVRSAIVTAATSHPASALS